jgi:DNA processing protein
MTSDYNRELLVVPGSIFSENSKGTHQFLKLGATPVTAPEDILHILKIESKAASQSETAATLTDMEKKVLELLFEPKERDVLIRALAIPTHEAAILLMQMEIAGYIVGDEGNYRKI